MQSQWLARAHLCGLRLASHNHIVARYSRFGLMLASTAPLMLEFHSTVPAATFLFVFAVIEEQLAVLSCMEAGFAQTLGHKLPRQVVVW